MALTDNLLAYWKLDNNGSGGVSLADSTGNGNTLTNNGGVALGTGKINGGAVFDGSAYLPADNLLSPTNVRTWSAWFKSEVGQAGAWFGIGNTFSENGRLLTINGDVYYQAPDAVTANSTGASYNDGEWHHAVISSDGTNIRLYVDGTLISEVENSSVGESPTQFRIGNGGDFTAICSIDEVGIWNRALNSAEVTSLYNGGAGNSYPFPTALYFNAAVDGNLATLGNWWQDSGFTTPADALPDNLYSVFITAPVTSGTATYLSATITANIGSAVSITANTITLNSGINSGTLVGSVVLNNSASNIGTITGAVTLNGSSFNNGTITGNATFRNSSSNSGGVVEGNATIYNPSANPVAGVVMGTETYLWPNGTGLWGGDVWINGDIAFIIPQPSDVRSGVEYGPASAPYTGTYSGGAAKAISISQLLKLPFPINV